MKNRKILVPLVLVVVLAVVYMMFLRKSGAEPHHKVEGEVYILPKEFLINLADGRYVKLSVALVMSPTAEPAEAGGGHGTPPPEGFGANPQEAVVRDIIIDEVTDGPDEMLISKHGRERLKKQILHEIEARSDVEAEDVLFTEVTVQ